MQFERLTLRWSKIIVTFFFLLVSAIATHATQTVKLAWNANPETNIAGYRVYIGTSSGVHDQVVDAGDNTIVQVSPLQEVTTYFFVVTAYNMEGFESMPSDEIAVTTFDSYPAWKIREGITDDTEDLDHDGLTVLMEYALGTTPNIPDKLPSPSIIQDFLTITYTRNKMAPDVIITPQVADTPNGPWSDNVIGVVIDEDEFTETILASDTIPSQAFTARFMRLFVR